MSAAFYFYYHQLAPYSQEHSPSGLNDNTVIGTSSVEPMGTLLDRLTCRTVSNNLTTILRIRLYAFTANRSTKPWPSSDGVTQLDMAAGSL